MKTIWNKVRFDPYVTILTFSILFFGFAIFFSASLGVMVRFESKFYNVIQNQFLFGVVLGTMVFFLGVFIPNKFFKYFSPILYFFAVLFCILVFTEKFGFAHGGARRWVEIFGFSFQPSEMLKYTSVLLLSSIYSFFYDKSNDPRYRLLPVFLVAIPVLLVLKEPDLGTSSIILAGIFSVFFIVNAKIKDILMTSILVLVVFLSFYMYYPHAKERVNTWIHPETNTADQSYQSKQTRISLGSGGLWGDGYGKSIQKFHNLPEPIGDSIFAVIGEEFGFAGTVFILVLIFSLSGRLIYLSYFLRDPYAKGVLVGTSIILLTQTFLNSGSASSAIPFTGVPLPLISHGSTSIIITLGMLGLCAQLGAKKYTHS